MLTEILANAIVACQKAGQEKGYNQPLGHGLNIHMRKIGDGVMLTIWREVVDPSAQEWNTVIAYWPWPLGFLNWSNSGVTDSGRHFKQVAIQLQSLEISQ